MQPLYLAPSLRASGVPVGRPEAVLHNGRVTARVKLAAGRAKRGLLERPHCGTAALRFFKTILAPFKTFNLAAVLVWFKSARRATLCCSILGCIWRFSALFAHRSRHFLFRIRSSSPAQIKSIHHHTSKQISTLFSHFQPCESNRCEMIGGLSAAEVLSSGLRNAPRPAFARALTETVVSSKIPATQGV